MLIINVGFLVYVIRRLANENAVLRSQDALGSNEHAPVLRDENIALAIMKHAGEGGGKNEMLSKR